jgi:hypothetical protein
VAIPTLADVVEYLGDSAARWTDDSGVTYPAIVETLAAETSAQAAACAVPASYPNALGLALKRRVARALTMRALPLAVLQGDAEIGSATFLPGRDPEVRRLEAPYRKLVAG